MPVTEPVDEPASEPAPKRRRRIPALLAAGAAGSLLMAMSMTGTLSAFVASIQNSVNTTSAGTLTMRETDSTGAITCDSTEGADNAAVCEEINKYGGATLLPGGTGSTTTVKITNTGTVTPSSFTLTGGACTQGGSAPTGITAATDFCSKVNVKVYAAATATGTPIYDGTAAAFTTPISLTPLAKDASQDYTFVVAIDSSAGNTYQGLTAEQALTWKFAA